MAEDKITTGEQNPDPRSSMKLGAPKGINIRHLNENELRLWSRAIHFATEKGMLPALRAAFSHLMPFIDENCDTAYTDCRYRIGLSPKLFDEEETSIEQLTFVMIHETMHNTQHHRQRLLEKKGINPKVSNFATDLEINGILASGIAGIDLNGKPCDETDKNGHWDWLFGKHRRLTAEEAEKMNKATTENGDQIYGRTYSEGDWCYTGALIPGHGEFHFFPLDLTAEQYLAYLEHDTEDMSLRDFMKQFGSGDDDKDNGQSNGGNSGNDGEDSDQMGGSRGSGDASPEGSEQPGDGGASSDDKDEKGSGDDGYSDGSGRELAGPDGYGGYGTYSGKNHVRVDKIYRKNPDGSKTQVGQDAFIDNIDVDADSDLWREVSEQLGLDPINRSEEQKVRDQIAHDIEEQRRTNSYGNAAGDKLLNYIMKGLRPPVVNWKRALRSAATRATEQQRKGRDDYSYKRISRRMSHSKYIFPGMISYVPTIRFALDTSGSMSADEYFNALSEAEAILRETHANLEVTCVDTVASKVRKVKTVAQFTKELVGGGGTDMAAAVHQVCEEPAKSRPDVLVIATDGCFNWELLGESLKDPRMKHTRVIVLVVYKFTDDAYFAKQGELTGYQRLLQKYDRNAQVLQAFVK